MKTISHAELVELIKNTKGAFPIGLLTNTEAKARKTGNPFGEIRKISRLVGFCGAKYEDAVNREGGRQGVDTNFEAESRSWGQWVVPNKVAEHKGRLYLRTQSTPGQREQSRAKVLSYLNLEGQPLKKSDIEQFLIEKSSSKKQENAGLSKEKQIEVREFAFDSIQKIRVNGKTYRLKP